MYGILGISIGLVGTIYSLLSIQFNEICIDCGRRSVHLESHKRASNFLWLFKLEAIYSVILFLLMFCITTFMPGILYNSNPELSRIKLTALIYTLTSLFSSGWLTTSGWLALSNRIREYQWVKVVHKVSILTLCPLFGVKWAAPGVAFGYAIGRLFATILSIYFCWSARHPNLRNLVHSKFYLNWRNLIRTTLHLKASVSLKAGYGSLDVVALGMFQPASRVGQYTFAKALLGYFSMISLPVNLLLLPRILNWEKNKQQKMTAKSLQWFAVICSLILFPLGLLLWGIFDKLILWTGKLDYAHSKQILLYLLPGIVATVATVWRRIFAISIGKTHLLTWFSAGTAAVSIPGYFLCAHLGVHAVAMFLSLVSLVAAVVWIFLLRKHAQAE